MTQYASPWLWFNHEIINNSIHSVKVNGVTYILKVGHCPKGSELERYSKESYDNQKGNKGLVWYCVAVNPKVGGVTGTNGITRELAIQKMISHIVSGKTTLRELDIEKGN
jgi:hypothetical protein